MDRNYTIFDNWRQFIDPLGAKNARVQAGWARCEPQPGLYDWEWLDVIVNGLNESGVSSWLQVSYGNPAYGPGAGTPSASSPLPTSPPALLAWHNWVSALVVRYSTKVSTWEIWNEPNCQNISASDYSIFTSSTATVIKAIQPGSSIRFGVICGVDVNYASALLSAMNHSRSLDLVDALTYHPYSYNPDSVYSAVDELGAVVQSLAPQITLAQGENGAPSIGGGYGALTQYNWTECSQAKWFLRRLLADGARGLPSNAFTIADICYIGGDGKVEVNHKGLLEANCSDKSIVRSKFAYTAVQHVTSVFSSALQPFAFVYPMGSVHVLLSEGQSCDAVGLSAKGSITAGVVSYVWAATDGSGALTIALWQNGSTPTNVGDSSTRYFDINITVASHANITSRVRDRQAFIAGEYVGVDMLSGSLFSLPGISRKAQIGSRTLLTFTGVPISDWPTLVTTKSLLRFAQKQM